MFLSEFFFSELLQNVVGYETASFFFETIQLKNIH